MSKLLSQCRALTAAIERYIEKADEDLTQVFRDAGIPNPEESVEQFGSLEEALTAELEAENERISSMVTQTTVAGIVMNDLPRIRSDTTLQVNVSNIMQSFYGDNTLKLADLYIKEVVSDMSVSVLSRNTTRWIGRWSNQLGHLMKLDDCHQIESILTGALYDGIGVEDAMRLIMDAGIRAPEYRARRCALTEMLRAHNVAHFEEMMQNPCVTDKRWRHSGGSKIEPRQNHVDMDKQTVAKDKPFTLLGADGGLYFPMYPMDSSLPAGESINCHCICQEIVDPGILGMSLEEREQLQQEAIAMLDDSFEDEYVESLYQ